MHQKRLESMRSEASDSKHDVGRLEISDLRVGDWIAENMEDDEDDDTAFPRGTDRLLPSDFADDKH